MKFAGLLVAFAFTAAFVLPSSAQERRTTTEEDVLTQGTVPAPDQGDIILTFGQTTQVFFKRAFKSIRLSDPLTVSATPLTDHIISFTALAPGESTIALESVDGKMSAVAGNVLVVRPPREVRIYTPKGSEKGPQNSGSGVMIVNNQSQTRETDEADYRSLLCNGISCQPPYKPGK